MFWFNLALGVVLLVALMRFVPNSADPQAGRVDVGGFLLGAVALGSLIYAGISGEQYGYSTWWIVALFVLSGVCVHRVRRRRVARAEPDARPELPA